MEKIQRNLRMITMLFFLFFISFSFPFPALAQTNDLIIQNYQLVSQVRVGRTEFDYTFRAQIGNNGSADALNVNATLTSLSPTTKVIDGSLAFGDVPAGTTVTSSDTFIVRIDRLYKFDPNKLSWFISKETGAVSTPTPAISVFSGALKQGNTTRALDFVTPSSKSKFEAIFAQLGSAGVQEVGQTIENATPVLVGEAYAEYQGIVTFPNGDQVIGKFTLIKTPEGWKFSQL